MYKSKLTTSRVRWLLGFVIPAIAVFVGLGSFALNYSQLPNMITIHFDISRVPTTAIPKPIFGLAMALILSMAVSACIRAAMSPRPIFKIGAIQLGQAGGFFAAIAASLLVGAVAIHLNLSDWREATGPGWWILLPGTMGILTGAITNELSKQLDRAE